MRARGNNSGNKTVLVEKIDALQEALVQKPQFLTNLQEDKAQTKPSPELMAFAKRQKMTQKNEAKRQQW